jgi:hypothetical protein
MRITIIIAGALSGTVVGPRTGGNLLLHKNRPEPLATVFLFDSIPVLIGIIYPLIGSGPGAEMN